MKKNCSYDGNWIWAVHHVANTVTEKLEDGKITEAAAVRQLRSVCGCGKKK